MPRPRPGEVWIADLGLSAKIRPVIIVSRLDTDPPRELVLYVPLTTQGRGGTYEVPITGAPFLDRDSVAKGLGSLATVRLERKLGALLNDVMRRLKATLAFTLELEQAPLH